MMLRLQQIILQDLEKIFSIYNKITTINDQIRDEKLQYDINRKAAEISALSSGKFDNYEYLTGNEILPFNQQQIIEQAKFTFSLLEKAFEKQIRTIEDQGKKQIEALKDLKPEEQTEAIKYEPKEKNNQSIATIIFNDLINKRKKIMNELYESADKNKLYFDYVGNTKDVRFYEYMDSEELFNELKANRIIFDETLKKKKQKELVKKINEVKMGKQTFEQEKVITNLESLYKSREDVFNFLETMLK